MKLSEINMEELQDRVRMLAAQHKPRMKMKDFYEKSGISSSLFSQWNTGKTNPSLGKLIDAANALDVTLEELIGAPVEEPSVEDSDWEMAAHGYIKKIYDVDDRKTVLKMLAALASQSEGKDDIGQTDGDLQ